MAAPLLVVMAVMMGGMLLGMVGVGLTWVKRRLGRRGGDAAVSELRQRYARGDIGEEEYRRRLEALDGSDQ